MKLKSTIDGWHETELTLEDWFAGMALQGLLSQRIEDDDEHESGTAGVVYPGSYISNTDTTEDAAEDAYNFAESMLVARKRIGKRRDYLEARHYEWERIAKALGDKEPECSGFGYWAGIIEAHSKEILQIIEKEVGNE
jgi:hypothetical protein